MSSHHIVRENQEPALLILHAEAFHLAVAHQLLEWSPMIIVTDAALEEVLTWGIKIDSVIAHQDAIEKMKEDLLHQAPVQLISYQDHDDVLKTCLYYLRAQRTAAVTILADKKTVLSHLEFFAETMDVVVYQQGVRWTYARSGKFDKWLAEGTQLKSIPATLAESVILTEGHVQIQYGQPFWIGEYM